MKYVKRRIAVFLSMVLVFGTVFVGAPMEEVQANVGDIVWAYNSDNWYNSDHNVFDSKNRHTYEVELGEKNFYVGDYILKIKKRDFTDRLTYHSGVTYRSDKPSVAKVNAKTGKVTTKAVGSAKISVSYQGKTATCTIKVVPASSLASYRPFSYIEMQAGAKKMLKFHGSKVTSKNRYTILKETSRYIEAFRWATYVGMKYSSEYCSGENESYTMYTMHVYSPTIIHALSLYQELRQYANKRNPFSTESSKTLKVKNISGKGKNVSVTFTKSVNTEQMFGAQYALMTKKPSNKKALKFPVYMLDLKKGKFQKADAVIKKGSKKMTITMKNGKLKKGRTYLLTFYNTNLKYYEDILKAPYTIKKFNFLYRMYGNDNNAWLSECKHSFKAK